jgi:subtilisin family serine protease
MKRQIVLSIAIVMVLMASMFAALAPKTFSEDDLGSETLLMRQGMSHDVSPYRVQELTAAELDAGVGTDPVPFNVDMVNAESSYTSNDGTGIYVAVLDTGILSDWINYFPPGQVNIDWAHAIGFTHNYYFNTTSWDFEMGPLRANRGPFTHDVYNPTPVALPNNAGTRYFNGTHVSSNPANLKGSCGWGSGHGSHVTSIMTGYQFTRTPVTAWIKGVAPKVTIIPVLVLDDWLLYGPYGSGWAIYSDHGGTNEMVEAGIRYIGDLAKNLGIKIIINMSLGGSSPSAAEKEAIDYAISQGVIIVASAGNSGLAGMGWPGAFPEVISAAAGGWTQEYGGGNYDYYWWWRDVPEKLNTNNVVLNWTHPGGYGDPNYVGPTGEFKNTWQAYLTDFSSRPNATLEQSWKDLDVCAPGAAIRGPYKGYGPNFAGFSAVWGTSQAAPHVAGIAALVLQSHPDLNQADMEWILQKAATRIPMPSKGAYVSDVFSYLYAPFACFKYDWQNHDAGRGFLTVDEALKTAGK